MMTEPQNHRGISFSAFQLILASVVTVAWLVSLIVRVMNPGLGDQFRVLDMVVLLVFGFIFGVNAIKKNGSSK